MKASSTGYTMSPVSYLTDGSHHTVPLPGISALPVRPGWLAGRLTRRTPSLNSFLHTVLLTATECLPASIILEIPLQCSNCLKTKDSLSAMTGSLTSARNSGIRLLNFDTGIMLYLFNDLRTRNILCIQKKTCLKH